MISFIRLEQQRLLQDNGTENIEFFVYDKNGDAKTTLKQTKNVLTQVPNNLSPINQDLQVEYLRPLRDAVKTTKTNSIRLLNKNPNFRYKTFNWDITASKATVQIPSQIVSIINPISGIYCLYQEAVPLISENTTHMIKNILSDTPIVSGLDIEVSWNYFIFAGQFGFSNFYQYFSIGLDSTNDGSVNKMYDFEENKFSTGTFTDNKFFQKIDYTTVDSWGKFKTTIKANLTPDETDPHIEVKLFRLARNQAHGGLITIIPAAETFVKAFYDGFEISQKTSSSKRVHIRRRGISFSYIDGSATQADENITGEYKQKISFLSNELDVNEVASIPFNFTRKNLPLNINVNTLDRCTLQEKINDFRTPVKRYEGTFYKDDNDTTPVYFYNKVWVNYGVSVLQEFVAAIIDELEYDVKQNQYRITMHLPNQDTDVAAFDLYKFE